MPVDQALGQIEAHKVTSSLSETRVDSQEKRLAQMENEMKSVFDHVMRRSARILQEALLVARVPNLTI